ncbi:hypothetical protein M9H77_29582 [Catharanthus roseus]|uniref:Uncharacterized protein n=1 Tax=Catharanthus roseus TaxID=4058 RepID=A0ACB9ZVW8_CATRO|nr:hypothetical protein M9H77_29582 [Catharanthus roseus]
MAPGHRVDLSDMEDIGWGLLLTVNELFYSEMINEFYANLYKGRVQKQGNITYQWVTSRVGGRDISFDDRMLNTILGILENDIRFYTKNNKFFQYFVLNLVGVGDHIGARKIYNKHTFKRIGFSKNEEGMLIRRGQDDNDESDEDDEENEGQEVMNVDEEESEEEPEEETFRREMR